MAPSANQAGQKRVLVVSLSMHLSGHPIQNVIEQNRERLPQESLPFDIVGFDVDGDDHPGSLEKLGAALDGGDFDGIMFGWCSRGYKERTALFEQIVDVSVAREAGAKLIFNTGADNIIEPLVRKFAVN